MIYDSEHLKEDIFPKNRLKDPFREENFVFKNTENEPKEEAQSIFKLNVHKKSKKSETPHKASPNVVKNQSKDLPEKRTLKEVISDAFRQIIASAIILVVGFLALNWSAYYQIAKSEWNKFMGEEKTSPLTELVEEKEPDTYRQTVLKTGQDVEARKRQIPALNLEIAPIDNRLIIPRIDQNIPIVSVSSENLIKRDWDGLERDMQEALKGGVVHYPGTSLPGEKGNAVITGHSSYFPWDPGRFKDVFALLHEVVIGDNILVYQDQKKYLYEVKDIDIVLPEEVDVLKQTPEDKLTLITCTPVGTNLKRLVVTAEPVNQDIKIAR